MGLQTTARWPNAACGDVLAILKKFYVSLEMQKQKLNEFLLSFNCYHQVTLPIYSHSENRH